MDKIYKHNVGERRTGTNEHILYDSSYIKFKNRQKVICVLRNKDWILHGGWVRGQES